MDETLLSIGELAAASGLSPKALRLYADSGLLVPRRVEHVTQDHTQVRSLLEAGRLSPEEAASHPDRAVLNRALAAGAPTAPDLLVRRLEPGDLVLVTTDGLHAAVDPSALAEALTGGAEDPESLAAALIELALAAGGPDNVGVALARV